MLGSFFYVSAGLPASLSLCLCVGGGRNAFVSSDMYQNFRYCTVRPWAKPEQSCSTCVKVSYSIRHKTHCLRTHLIKGSAITCWTPSWGKEPPPKKFTHADCEVQLWTIVSRTHNRWPKWMPCLLLPAVALCTTCQHIAEESSEWQYVAIVLRGTLFQLKSQQRGAYTMALSAIYRDLTLLHKLEQMKEQCRLRDRHSHVQVFADSTLTFTFEYHPVHKHLKSNNASCSICSFEIAWCRWCLIWPFKLSQWCHDVGTGTFLCVLANEKSVCGRHQEGKWTCRGLTEASPALWSHFQGAGTTKVSGTKWGLALPHWTPARVRYFATLHCSFTVLC